MTRWQRFLHALGFHFWYYIDQPWSLIPGYCDSYRKCKFCTVLEQSVVGAGVGAGSMEQIWFEI